jgi:uncharacterized repeat protein (TIGR03803 family)
MTPGPGGWGQTGSDMRQFDKDDMIKRYDEEDSINMTIERGKSGGRSRLSARGLRMGLLGLACLAAVSGTASAQVTEEVLCSFGSVNCPAGGGPSGVIMDSEGNLYGGTLAGGTHDKGVAYKLAPSGQETVLYNFCSRGGELCTDGWAADVSVLDSEGNLYGSAGFGGAHNVGDVYKLTASGQETVLHSFCSLAKCTDGSAPNGGPIMDSEGNLYGTTLYGGASSSGSGVTSGAGVLYKLAPSGSETVLYNFCSLANCADGALPSGRLLMDSEGNLYGTTIEGGPNGGISAGDGVVFKVAPSGQETVLCSFGSASCPVGANPNSGVISDSEGNLYGTTSKGGAHAKGVAFELDASGQETVLYNFCSLTNCADGEQPGSVVRDSAGNLYGSAGDGPKNNPGNGLVWELSTSGSETVLCSFGSTNCPSGIGPSGGLIIDSEDNLYGTTSDGGKNGGGIVFKLEPQPLPMRTRSSM